MTLDELKEALSTYGVNADERAMPIVVRTGAYDVGGPDERFYLVTAAAVEYDGWPQTGQVMLQANPTVAE